jgi:pre-mRNA-processing factor SLU7
MNAPRIPISQLLNDKSADTPTEDTNQKKSREDWRKAKELEEARKAGQAPAAVDEEGKFSEFLTIIFFSSGSF